MGRLEVWRGWGWGGGSVRGGGRGAYLNQPVVAALRPTCQQPSNSRFLFHSVFLSQSLSGSTFPSLPLPLYLSLSIYLFASHHLYSFTSLHFRQYKTNNSHLSRYASLTVICTSQQVIGNSAGHWTQGDYLSWQLVI